MTINDVLLASFRLDEILFFSLGILIAVAFSGGFQEVVAEIFRSEPSKHEVKPNFNPLAHLDPRALIVFFAGGFGWAKLPRIDESELNRPKIALLVIGFLGAFVNLLIAVSASTVADIIGHDRVFTVVINLNAAVFAYHFLPIPPLAGSRVVYLLTPEKLEGVWRFYAAIGPFLLMAIATLQRFTEIALLDNLVQPILNVIGKILAISY